MVWTRFMDMHSGGGSKEDFAYCYIEAPINEAKTIFRKRYGHDPDDVTCECCGEDYNVDESETLEEATAYERGCAYDVKTGGYVERPETRTFAKPYVLLETLLRDRVLDDYDYGDTVSVVFIFADDIKPEERLGDVPEQGYVWRG